MTVDAEYTAWRATARATTRSGARDVVCSYGARAVNVRHGDTRPVLRVQRSHARAVRTAQIATRCTEARALLTQYDA